MNRNGRKRTFGYELVLPLMIDYGRLSVILPPDPVTIGNFFYSQLIGKFNFQKHIILPFDFYR